MTTTNRRNWAQFLVIGVIAAIVVVVLAVSTSVQSEQREALESNQRADSDAVAATQSFSASDEPLSSAVATDQLPQELSPPGEPIRTSDEAIEHAMVIAQNQLRADAVRPADASKLSYAEARTENAVRSGEPANFALDGVPLADRSKQVWTVVLDGTFEIPRCLAPPIEAAEVKRSCGTGSQAVLTIDAATGDVLEMSILTAD